MQLGADPLALGLLAAASTGAYALVVPFSGRAADRLPRLLLARLACVGVILACLALTLADRLPVLIACMPLVGGSIAFFWPSVQAEIADRSRELGRDVGRFNLSWSLGKGCGFLIGGLLLAAAGPETTLTVSCMILFVMFFLLPLADTRLGPVEVLARRARGERVVESDLPDGTPTPVPPPEVALDPRVGLYRRIAWLANSTAFGLGATLTYHYPGWVALRGWSPRVFGTLLGLVYLTQTIVFAFLMHRPEAWRFRRGALYGPQLVLLVAMAALPLADFARMGVSAIAIGAGLGVCYCSSLYYSLLATAGRGRNAGTHEALIGVGSMLVPLLGGLLAKATGMAWAPYWTAAAAVGLSLVWQEIEVRRAAARG